MKKIYSENYRIVEKKLKMLRNEINKQIKKKLRKDYLILERWWIKWGVEGQREIGWLNMIGILYLYVWKFQGEFYQFV